ncbi:MAG: AAA family ATPase [Spirochaetaceae bacterium]|jgi:predicted ATP-dependent endonuclease of OLD family|nr:AAA family ATPase [Spirochaetaceae bacterium]
MKLKNIKIEKLFGQFDYDIELNQEEGITILTGPNGYGKTTVLNIVFDSDHRGTGYYNSLIFDKILLNFDNDDCSIIEKKYKDNREKWELITTWAKKTPKLYFIKDQRLVSQVDKTPNYAPSQKQYENVPTIELYAREIRDTLSAIKNKENNLMGQLSNSQNQRYIECMPLSDRKYEDKFSLVMQKYNKLLDIGIYEEPLKSSDYTEKKFLTLFLLDLEKRILLYDDIIPNITLFNDLINAKELANKNIKINFDNGFLAKSINNKNIALSRLSSGEQEQVILLYELIFKTKNEAIVLIDEPETSMHVAWQQLFLKDLEQIGKLNSLSFLVATHSPDIIGDKLKWVVDLYELSRRDAE